MGGSKTSRNVGLWTPANIVTCARIVLIPVFLVIAETLGPLGSLSSTGALVVTVAFGLLAMSDKLDGYLARSRGEVTTFGKFLDPIADKLLVVTALLVLLEWGLVPVWTIVVIVAREFLVSGLRMVVASKGVVVAASNLGKWKTATTMTAIAGFFLFSALGADMGGVVRILADVIYYLAVALTVWSGADYFVKCWGYLFDSEDAGGE